MDPQVFIVFGMFLLVFARIVTLFVQAPVWGSHHMPMQILAGTAAVLSVIILPQLPVPSPFPYDIFHFGFLILLQCLVGLVLGFTSFLVLAAAQFAGELLDIQMGLSVAAAFDPASRGVVNLIRRFKFYFAMNVYLVLDGHHKLLEALHESFFVIPLTGIRYGGDVITELIHLTGRLFYIGVQIAAPVLAALFIVQVTLGLLSRVAPQMNVFMLSFPLNIAVGVLLMFLSLPVLFTALSNNFSINYSNLRDIIKMMMPGSS
jgi:flagellar biosynthetic protein FliR